MGYRGTHLRPLPKPTEDQLPNPDAEDINRDNTMNTIDSYYEYELDIPVQVR